MNSNALDAEDLARIFKDAGYPESRDFKAIDGRSGEAIAG
jgi:hypothetical protein